MSGYIIGAVVAALVAWFSWVCDPRQKEVEPSPIRVWQFKWRETIVAFGVLVVIVAFSYGIGQWLLHSHPR